jgi:tetratricopeptide (TPR) repeat protein
MTPMPSVSVFLRAAAALSLAAAILPAHAVDCHVRTSPLSPGDIAMSHGNYAQAEALYAGESQAASQPGPDADRAHAALIRAQLRQSKIADAEKDTVAWSTAQPDNSWALVALAELRWRQGRTDDAIQTLDSIRSNDYCNPQAHADLATVYRMRGLYASANRELTSARHLDPMDDDIESDWMRLQSRSIQLTEVTQYLDRSTFLSADERKSLTRWKDQLAQPPASGCRLVSSAASTSIPFRGIQDGPQAHTYWGLEVSFNGKQRRLEIDTGATGLILNKAAAAALHLEPEQRIKVSGVGDDPDVDAYVANVKSIKIGGLEFQDCDVQVLSKGADDGDGLIGGDVFSQFLLTLDFPGHTLKLDPLPARPNDTADKSAPSLQTGVTSDSGTPEDAYRDPSMKSWSGIWRNGHDLIIPVRLNEKGPWKLFIVDTGAQVELISPDAAREVGKVSKGAGIDLEGISGKVKKEYTTGPMKLYFGGLAAPNDGMVAIDTSRFSRDAGIEISGFIGAPSLHQLTFSIDYRDNLVHFTFDPKRLSRCVEGIKMADCY